MTNEELVGHIQESVALVAMAIHMLNDPDDRLGMREKWMEKANEVVENYYVNIAGVGGNSEKAQYTAFIGY